MYYVSVEILSSIWKLNNINKYCILRIIKIYRFWPLSRIFTRIEKRRENKYLKCTYNIMDILIICTDIHWNGVLK